MIKNFDEPSNAFIHMNLSEIIFEKPGAQIKNGLHFISTEARLITCSTVEVQNYLHNSIELRLSTILFPQTKANLKKFKLESSAQFSLSCVQLISTFIQLLAFKRLTVFSGFLPRAECSAWQDYQNTAGDE